jgi:proton-coupled amino acid transporter
MEEPKKFKRVFVISMALVACMLASFATICVLTFGEVTSGSITAFLLQAYPDDESITTWIMVANAAISCSILLTYPLQLFPAVELVGPAMQRNKWLAKFFRQAAAAEEEDEDNDLSGFEPLPPLPEHDVASIDSMPSEHHYGLEEDDFNNKNAKDVDAESFSGVSSVTSMFPRMTLPGDSPQLRAALVLLTFAIALVVPNVQALISLAGALAGSSTALLIPPVLELAWIEHLEEIKTFPDNVATTTLPPSPHTMRMAATKSKKPSSKKYRNEKIKCYVLLFFGFIFMFIGTYASIADIVKIYRGTK